MQGSKLRTPLLEVYVMDMTMFKYSSRLSSRSRNRNKFNFDCSIFFSSSSRRRRRCSFQLDLRTQKGSREAIKKRELMMKPSVSLSYFLDNLFYFLIFLRNPLLILSFLLSARCTQC